MKKKISLSIFFFLIIVKLDACSDEKMEKTETKLTESENMEFTVIREDKKIYSLKSLNAVIKPGNIFDLKKVELDFFAPDKSKYTLNALSAIYQKENKVLDLSGINGINQDKKLSFNSDKLSFDENNLSINSGPVILNFQGNRFKADKMQLREEFNKIILYNVSARLNY